MNPSVNRPRPRFSRTFSRGRWPEYRRFLLTARQLGYRLVSLESWVRDPAENGDPVLIMRHDVDQHPRSALRMAEIERDLGVRSSWYFRWRTADPAVVRELRARGSDVGLHYETLSRKALERGLRGPADGEMVAQSRAELRHEIAAFSRLIGPIRSACPHGDSRIPSAHNALLMKGQDCSAYGIEFDGNEAMRGRGIAYWLTDRTAAEGHWKDGVDPFELFAQRISPVLCLTHPNNWASGPSLWLDRVLSATLPAPSLQSHSWRTPLRTGSDHPPV